MIRVPFRGAARLPFRVSLALLPLLLSGCVTQFGFSPTPIATSPAAAPSAAAPGTTSITLRTLKPTLAVRGMACLMCHANIQANVVTDFGYGNPWFLTNTGGSNFTDMGWYDDYVQTWQTATIQGSVFVPNVQVPANVLANIGNTVADDSGSVVSMPGPMTLASLLTTPFPTSLANLGWTTGNQGQSAMSYGVSPPSGSAPVVSYNSISILNFEDSQILALSPTLLGSSADAAFHQESVAGVHNAQLSGLQIAGNASTGHYVTNMPGQTLVCSGADVVVKGPLFLNSVSINADNGGCRFYVAGSVFIQGPITYVGSSSTPNIQISSSRIVSMGLGYGYSSAAAGNCYPSCNSLQYRLQGDVRGAQVAGTSFADRGNQILSDAATIGFLQDAQDTTGMTLPTALSASNIPRIAINFSGILLNAPILESRYMGSVKGTMISDIALFSLGAFSFQYDPVFENVPALPLLPTSPLSVQ